MIQIITDNLEVGQMPTRITWVVKTSVLAFHHVDTPATIVATLNLVEGELQDWNKDDSWGIEYMNWLYALQVGIKSFVFHGLKDRRKKQFLCIYYPHTKFRGASYNPEKHPHSGGGYLIDGAKIDALWQLMRDNQRGED